MESNKMLREEKDKTEQELQQTQAKVSVIYAVLFLKSNTSKFRFLSSSSVFYSYKSWSRTSCPCSKPTLSWARRVACCRQRRRYWRKRSNAGKLGHRSVKTWLKRKSKPLQCWGSMHLLFEKYSLLFFSFKKIFDILVYYLLTHVLVYFSIWLASKKIQIQKSTSVCTLKRRYTSNVFSSSLRTTPNLKQRFLGEGI